MSGTSMDGIDLALLQAHTEPRPSISAMIAHLHVPFDATIKSAIRAVLQTTQTSSASQYAENLLNQAYIDAVRQWQQHYPQHAIDVIGLHGQTITHKPDQKFTWQLGDGNAIAAALNLPVLFDFRRNDVLAGGEGAPLAPVFHQALMQAGMLPAAPLAVLNVGGVSNISLIGDDTLIAFDCGPGNGPMDDYCQQVLQKAFDKDGEIAARGKVNHTILHTLMQQDYFHRPAPKSLDRQDFNHNCVIKLAPADALSTLCAFTAQTIVLAIQQYQQQFPLRHIAVAGGGRHNRTLMNMLASLLPTINIQSIEVLNPQLEGDAIEAWAFAWLAILRLCDCPASFPMTTGVAQPTLGGTLAMPKGV